MHNYLIHSFLLRFLINYSFDPSNKNNSNNAAKDSKKKKLQIIGGVDEFLALILKEYFEKNKRK